KQQRDFSECIVISIAYAATIGGLATIIGTPPNGIFIAQMETIFPQAPPIDFFTWMKFAFPLACIFLPLSWLWLTLGPYRDMPKKITSGKGIIQERLNALGEMSRGEKWTLIVFALTAFAWIMRSEKHLGDFVIPGITTFLPMVDDSTIAIAGAVSLFLLPVNRGEGVYTMNWDWAKKIPWGILILFGGGICLSAAFIKSGLATVIMNSMTFMHGLPVIVVILLVAIVVSMLTEVTSNTAIASVMMPVMAVTSISMGIHPYLLMIPAAMACSMAFMLPVATPPNAVVFGSGYVTMRDMMRTGFILNIIGVMLLAIFMLTIITWVLGLSYEIPQWALEPVTGL
ncbi:MAG: SLC13 family permease, partial [Methanomicrobium sp.]|nr:SLC13 family permease [Methanomicrobium sp.]